MQNQSRENRFMLEPSRCGLQLSIGRALLIGMLLPAAASVSLSIALGGREVTGLGLLLIASGTMAAYGLDRLIDHRDRDSKARRRIVLICVVLASLTAGVIACTTWWRFQVCSVLALIAGGYVPLKRYVPKNLLTTAAWTTATATLPFATQPSFHTSFAWAVLTVALIVLANTILCDIPDVESDQRTGVRGITPRFGPRAGAIAAMICGTLALVAASITGSLGLILTSIALSVLAIVAMNRPDHKSIRLLADIFVTILPGPFALMFS
jgi:4-hydroxybenzoate polyprenyltransferase